MRHRESRTKRSLSVWAKKGIDAKTMRKQFGGTRHCRGDHERDIGTNVYNAAMRGKPGRAASG